MSLLVNFTWFHLNLRLLTFTQNFFLNQLRSLFQVVLKFLAPHRSLTTLLMAQ